MNFLDLLFKKLKEDEWASQEFLDDSSLLYQTLLMFIDKYFSSFIVSDGNIQDLRSGYKYEFSRIGTTLCLFPRIEKEVKMIDGIFSFGISPTSISICAIKDNVYFIESFNYKTGCVTLDTSLYNSRQIEQKFDLISNTRPPAYNIKLEFIDIPSVMIRGKYNIRPDGTVSSYSFKEESPYFDIKKDLKIEKPNFIMDPYSAQRNYIENQGYFEMMMEDELAIR